VGRILVANRLLAGSACGKRRRGRPLNSVVRPQDVARRPARSLTENEALLSFPLWVERGMKPSIQNVAALRRANPPGIKNPVLTFVVPRAMNYVVERFVLEVVQAWELLNAQLKQYGLRTLGTTHKDYRHLKRIRNKLVAHKIENNLRTGRHESWYKRTYGSYDSVLALVERVAERVADRIRHLEATGKIFSKSTSTEGVQLFTDLDIEALLEALRKQGIY
jgi:hypothetical protein